MAQIIKHRRGSIDSVKNSTSRKGELIMATGSIGSMSGPFVFIGTDEGSGLYSPASKLYAGSTAPTLNATTYGTTLDGTPFYASDDKSLYILNNSNTGNSKVDLTGNIEGNTISGVTINNLQSTNVTASYVSGAFKGDGTNLYNIPATGITGLNLAKIYSGSVQVTTDAVSGEIHLDATSGVYVSGTSINLNGETNITGTIHIGDNTSSQIYNDGVLFIEDNSNGVTIQSDNYAELQTSNAWVWVENSSAYVEGGNYTRITTDSGNVDIFSYDNGTLNLNTDGGEGDVNVLNGSNNLNINGSTYLNNVYGYNNGQINLASNDYVQLEYDGTNYLWVDSNGINIEGPSNFTGSVNISGDTSVTGAFIVSNGNATVDYIQGYTEQWNYLALNGGALGAPNVELSSAGDISLYAEGGTVNVTGSLKVTGDIVFSGSINLGDFTGDTINFNGEVTTDILPQSGSTFNLGSSGQTWNSIYADNGYFSNVTLSGVTLDSLTLPGDLTVSGSTQFSGSVGISNFVETDVVFVGVDGTLVNDDSFTYNSGDGILTAPQIRASNNGSGYNFQVGNDMWIGDINEANTMMFKGYEDENYAKILFGNYTDLNYLYSETDTLYLHSDSNLNMQSQNGAVNIDSYDGNINLNTDSNNNISIGGNTYVDNNRTLYVNNLRDNSDNSNYLQLYGYGTDNGYWWESGNGSDTTLNNTWGGANTNILNTNDGNVNIDSTNGSVNLHSANGFNVTGSMIVSDGSGVFNSSLIVNNSNLTLDNGSNLEIQDSGTLTVDGEGNFHTHVYITGNTYSDNYAGLTNSGNALHLNGGSQGAQDVELQSYNQISLFAEGVGGNAQINLTGSVYSTDNIQINNGNYLYTNNIYDVNGDDLNIAANGGLYLWSDSARYVEIASDNAEGGVNYMVVENNDVYFSTYDYTSGLTHKVMLDNTGSLRFENVAIGITGSLNVDGTLDVMGVTHIHNDLYVSGNFTVLGSGTTVHLSSSQVDLGTNIINLNTYAPFERFAGISVYDSGSNVGVTGSLLWDSTNNVWIYANPSGSAYASARFISGPQNTGSLGNETGLSNGHFPIATGDDHISDSLLTYQGTTLALNTNKFTVDSTSGDVEILGNFTIMGAGATDNGENSSYIVFRNDENMLGFVDTADTGNQTDRLLGYNATTGVLEFSSLIDGGTY